MNFHLFQPVDNASVAIVFGSGNGETKRGSLALLRDANRSTSSTPSVLHRRQNELRSSFSPAIGVVLERASASVFRILEYIRYIETV
jgi:hypothetical protein